MLLQLEDCCTVARAAFAKILEGLRGAAAFQGVATLLPTAWATDARLPPSPPEALGRTERRGRELGLTAWA